MEQNIIKFINFLNDNLENINSKIIKRNSKLKFKDVFYYIMILISNANKSSTIVNDHMKINKCVNVSKEAFFKKRNIINETLFNELFDNLLNYFYDDNNFTKCKKTKKINKLIENKRILCCDGTYLQLNKLLSNEGYKLTKNKSYCSCLVGGIYDISNDVIIDLALSKIRDERKICISQFNYFKKDDIVIFDRGYFSIDFLFELLERQVDVVFRLKNSLNVLKNNKKDYIIELNKDDKVKKFRIIKFQIKNNDKIKKYHIGTTLLDVSYNYIVDLYKKRWQIETYFKTSKYSQSLNEVHTKKEKLIKQEIYMHKCVMIITKILIKIYSYEKYYEKNKKYKINLKNFLDKVNDIMIKIIYKNDTKDAAKNIITILKIISVTLVKIVNERTFDRIRIKPPSKWYNDGLKNKNGPDKVR